ncbi:3-dehydroquinate synthase [Mangrovimonas cancribranchiae]|uniref:3-dehydroquinate synthase n=1 Tax=Mangrovimonas cancribranchiae TaxID=3080055 RepID=A0AAU6PAX3_9FLAO
MISIKTNNCDIHFNKSCYTHLNKYLSSNNISKVFLLVDENTHNTCLPYFLGHVETDLPIEIIEIESGEEHKNIETCLGVWKALTELDADRKSLMINLGGGVITDIGGFIASTYKRGITYINVPTSLLAMVDASIGGKTGVDLGGLKNQIGVINSGDMVLIDTTFLRSLPENQMRSGIAEMLKHGLIQDEKHWNAFKKLESMTQEEFDTLIYESILIKKAVVEEDPNELGLRKILNFGHTLGHAIETYFLNNTEKEALLHGEAIAIGMIMESYISTKQEELPKTAAIDIKETILKLFGHVNIGDNDVTPIIDLLKYDKKNEHGNINFVLLENISQPKIDCQVETSLLHEAFQFYSS